MVWLVRLPSFVDEVEKKRYDREREREKERESNAAAAAVAA